ncbi:hypothetical protein [Flavilitoribacter nigricans]|uniref:SPOR domain-containing protein n=1 Tax=Flavilitoribacter nigricans (strain ATCC 23147 / DSM 23189 / NBRC 102662 / NCIMB 1420 / SS-2) TaxID=1122177 RepID=A0A2D0NG26_FLAN2|nr:hypothetical protein [Flavilitoribacter nigricans]PHN07119.1 hypothetical protein CRP01_07780 [Flavilitoribacter nigricans DSM 23189 = NBRC 102662]
MKYFAPVMFAIVTLVFSSCGSSKELTAEVESTRSSLQQCQDELATAQMNLSAATQELDQAKNMLGGRGDQMTQIQNENRALRDQLTQTQAQLATVTQQMQASSDSYGTWYRVQIGAFEQRRVDNSLETTDKLSLETQNDLQKTALGRFRNYDDAKKLQDHLKSIGLKDAWIVTYKDGVRVPIESVKGK